MSDMTTTSRTRAASLDPTPAYAAAPAVYAQRAYLRTLSRGSGNARKVVIAATNTDNVVSLDLQEKLRPDMLDVFPPGATGD